MSGPLDRWVRAYRPLRLRGHLTEGHWITARRAPHPEAGASARRPRLSLLALLPRVFPGWR